MNKWADFGISAVRYGLDKTHIDKIKVHEDNVDSMGQAVEKRRKQIISRMKQGKTAVTILMKNGGCRKEEEVHIITVDGEDFLRTDNNKEKSDNLENLPEF